MEYSKTICTGLCGQSNFMLLSTLHATKSEIRVGGQVKAGSQSAGTNLGLLTGNCNLNEPYERSEGRGSVQIL